MQYIWPDFQTSSTPSSKNVRNAKNAKHERNSIDITEHSDREGGSEGTDIDVVQNE